MVKIATWNICLGLKSKKLYVSKMIEDNSIDICCIQECEIPRDYPSNILSFKNFSLEIENNEQKSRCCTFIRDGIPYVRRTDLEGMNNNLVIIEVKSNIQRYLIINLYRSFSQQGDIRPDIRFATQVNIITNSIKNNPQLVPVVVGDFNLNYTLNNNITYNYKRLFDILNVAVTECGLTQIVNFPTWSRNINGVHKESILDHIYLSDITKMVAVTNIIPEIGDHKLIILETSDKLVEPKKLKKRNWREYSVELLTTELSKCSFDYSITNVQQYWNSLENKIINVVDIVAPVVEFINNYTTNTSPQTLIKPLIYQKRRLLKKYKTNGDPNSLIKIKELNKKITDIGRNQKRNSIRRSLVPGNTKSLWNAVNLAKDINPNNIPKNMTNNDVDIDPEDLSNAFAGYFDSKVKSIVETCRIDDGVYNGIRRVHSINSNFMSTKNIHDALKSIKIKNCEGYDRIPQRILIEGCDVLLPPIKRLFELIYEQKTIPQQWSISKIIPIHKKGPKTSIQNYRPIANLCAITKVFEQLIINRIREIEKCNSTDITGKSQHGFKKDRSTATAGLTIQSILSHALDRNEFALMSSIDLSAAFDVVNIKLLIKRLEIIGLPTDVILLIKAWLNNRLFYVDVDGNCSYITTSESGTIQGSRLGPILYAIYVSPLFDLQKMTNYADDNLIIRWNICLQSLIDDMEKDLEAITKWLKESGLKVNEIKTELCLFHRNSHEPIQLTLNNVTITSSEFMNVLGVTFDSRLNWNEQIARTVNKTNTALHCIRQIKYYFTPDELLQIITSNVYSILYYNSEIWNIPTLNYEAKQKLLSVSSSALKLCTPTYHDRMSFAELHAINKRATPTQMCIYKHALLLYKLLKTEIPSLDWIDLNFQQSFNQREQTFKFFSTNNYRVGCNSICNRMNILNGTLQLTSVENSFESFKVHCKNTYLGP